MNNLKNNTDKPVIVFLIPLASCSAKAKWDIACDQLRQTLASIRNSIDGNFRVVVAGNELPGLGETLDDRFCFVSLEKTAPAHPSPRVAGRLDKLLKITAAWETAKSRWNPHYIMKLDADDFISSRLVGWLARNQGAPGYLISNGWLWESGARFFLERTETLDRICGSCLIIRHDLVERTGPFRTATEGVVMSEENARFAAADQYSLVPGSATSTLLANDSHQRWSAQFAYLGHQLASIPFPAVIYRFGNPDSNTWSDGTYRSRKRYHSIRMFAGSLRRTRLITGALKREFLLP
jgi:hypothetical protein